MELHFRIQAVPQRNAPDTNHDWVVAFSLADLAKIIDETANVVFSKSPSELHQALSPMASSLQRLVMCAAGYSPPKPN